MVDRDNYNSANDIQDNSNTLSMLLKDIKKSKTFDYIVNPRDIETIDTSVLYLAIMAEMLDDSYPLEVEFNKRLEQFK